MSSVYLVSWVSELITFIYKVQGNRVIAVKADLLEISLHFQITLLFNLKDKITFSLTTEFPVALPSSFLYFANLWGINPLTKHNVDIG